MAIPKTTYTIQEPFEMQGHGVHTGEAVSLRFFPSDPGSGIRFLRTDKDQFCIPLSLDSLSFSERATLLQKGDLRVRTPEHLLSALYALSIFDIEIHLDSEELPILDGSAQGFVDAIQSVGLRDQGLAIAPFQVSEERLFSEGDKSIRLIPDTVFKITARIFFPGTILQEQSYTIVLTPESYCKEIAQARTFGFEKDYHALLEKGLARGANLDNVLVIGETDFLTPPRFEDECVRHKILDIIGDFSLLGRPFLGHIIADKTGHDFHAHVVKELMSSSS